MKNIWHKVSDGLLLIAVVFGGYGIYNVITDKMNLPPGMCPVDDQRPLLYTAIALGIGSIILSYWGDYKYSKMSSE